ncbi:DUF6268 family outer membrane beta-barrel protein [Pedobacter cryoconitis]|uniref:Outer membrane protein with beta-barrel domain n=1 Tax=Pedobacter cryoconitis TaxID=188932 RepID=A0A7X0J2U4_9SPHI|nr:DUF6268 family outer membrane beta-barrel protein [Pedobacter cryoconitis]MBB6499860.1 hypothetical protein [Pedobacter cryoconitis]
MNRIKRTVTTLSMLVSAINCFSQITDSIPKKFATFTTDKFAITRPLNLEFTYTTPYSFKSEKGGNMLPESRISRFQQAKVSANINFIKRKTWLLSTTLGYSYTSTEAQIVQPGTEKSITIANNFQYLFSSLNLTYFSSLFGKRIIYNSSVIVDGSNKYLERVRGIFTGTMVLKANQRTKMTAGFLVSIDPSAQTPFLPTFSYEHKFNNGLIADIVLPRSLYLRKMVFNNNGRISLGSELDRTSFYLYNLDGTNQKYEYRQLDINSGLTYEHAIGKYFMITAKSGMKYTPSGRIFKKEESFADPVYKITPDPAFYFKMGISFNPFSVLGKKH